MTELPPQFIQLSTPRFRLRSLQPGDAGPDLETWTLDPIVAEMMNAEQKAWTVDRQRAFFTEGLARSDRRVIGIFPEGSNKPIGFYILRLNAPNGTFVVSTLVGDKIWRGQDVTIECGREIYRLLFVEMNFHKGKANVLTSNKSMLWLMAHSAWRREGRLRKQLRNQTTGERMDVFAYGLLKSDWLSYRERREQEAATPPDGAVG